MFATEPTLCVIGLGYVGLPLAAEFGKHLNTIGFDINPHRIEQLRDGIDHTRELSTEELSAASRLSFTSVEDDIRARSEEHTSELQSRGHLVCRLLLAKKKKIKIKFMRK